MADPAKPIKGDTLLTFDYTNHRGVTFRRRVYPTLIYFGDHAAYDGEHWFMEAFCLDRQEHRTFAMHKMKDIEEDVYYG